METIISLLSIIIFKVRTQYKYYRILIKAQVATPHCNINLNLLI